MTTTTYREATGDDANVLAELRYAMECERNPGEPAPDHEAYLAAHREVTREWMARGELHAWLAEADGTPVACVILLDWRMHPNFSDPQRRRGLVTGVYTQPAYRRQGIGRQLMERLVAHARERHITRLVLWASQMGAPLYEQVGFVPSRAMEWNLD